MNTLAFTFTKLIVADRKRETAFYRDALGLHLVGRASTDEHEEAIMAIPGVQEGPLLMLMRYFDSPLHRQVLPASDSPSIICPRQSRLSKRAAGVLSSRRRAPLNTD